MGLLHSLHFVFYSLLILLQFPINYVMFWHLLLWSLSYVWQLVRVGAQRTVFFPCALYNSIIVLIIVVFPVPGPPVMMHTLFSFTASIASFCFSDNSISVCFSIFFNSFSKCGIFLILLARFKIVIFSAIVSSAV